MTRKSIWRFGVVQLYNWEKTKKIILQSLFVYRMCAELYFKISLCQSYFTFHVFVQTINNNYSGCNTVNKIEKYFLNPSFGLLV